MDLFSDAIEAAAKSPLVLSAWGPAQSRFELQERWIDGEMMMLRIVDNATGQEVARWFWKVA